jgi:hypothetical protein
MVIKTLMKNPVLIMGILMMGLFLNSLRTGSNKIFINRKIEAYSCTAVVVKLERNVPATWSLNCNKNNLEVYIKYDKVFKQVIHVKPFLYRELANNMTQIAKNSPYETLERVNIITLKIENPQMEINAVTEGKFIVKLANFKTNKFLSEHLKATVQVQEKIK